MAPVPATRAVRQFLFGVACACLCRTPLAQSDSKSFLAARESYIQLLGERGAAEILAELEQLDRVVETGSKRALEIKADRLEEALRHIFRLAPKDSSGRVDAQAARYALHRLFVERHGWFVVGVELHGAFRNSSKTSEALYSGARFSLRDLARFGATLETLVHAENVQRLQEVFDAHGFALNSTKHDNAAKLAIESYMMMYVMTDNPFKPPKLTEARKRLQRRVMSPSWGEIAIFAEEVRRAVFEMSEVLRSQSLWEACLMVVEELGERYGKWQSRECVTMKNRLVAMETPGTGRVPLNVFWDGLVKRGEDQFVESIPYLEQLGALDSTSDFPHQSVIIPNYVNSHTNCFVFSKYYDTCCINECLALLGQMEAHVDASAMPPQRLADIVAGIPSSTVIAPRELPQTLVRKLESIATYHGGLVPVHGRLFAQFMSHAFPRECPYPSLSNSAKANSSEWIGLFDPLVYVAKSAARKYIDAVDQALLAGDAVAPSELPWTEEEELFMSSLQHHANVASYDPSFAVPSVGLLLAASAMALALRSAFARGLGISTSDSKKGYFV